MYKKNRFFLFEADLALDLFQILLFILSKVASKNFVGV